MSSKTKKAAILAASPAKVSFSKNHRDQINIFIENLQKASCYIKEQSQNIKFEIFFFLMAKMVFDL